MIFKKKNIPRTIGLIRLLFTTIKYNEDSMSVLDIISSVVEWL